MALKKLIKKIIPEKYHWQVYNKLKDVTGWRSKSYSALGEDMVVSQLVGHKKNGFYVDVGAFHPFKYSNTCYFRKNFNWTGINVEPNPVNFRLFEKERATDVNLNIGISMEEGSLDYFMFSDGLYNTFDGSRKEELIAEGIPFLGKKTIAVSPLAKVFSEHLRGRVVDFLNVDVEMLDLEVLKTIDWSLVRPRVIAVEDHVLNLSSVSESPIYSFLSAQGYVLESKCHFTSIYSLKPDSSCPSDG